MLKCITFPYKLGSVKCVKDPCVECRLSGRLTHPFKSKAVVKNQGFPQCENSKPGNSIANADGYKPLI